jgi:hypothetical protein
MVMGVFYSIYTYNIEGKGTEKERKRNGKGTTKERGQKGRRTLWQILQKEEDTLVKIPPKGGRFGENSS